MPVLLEVNISREPAKHGFVPEEVELLLPQLIALPHIEIRGLMCMAGLEGGGDEARREFAAVRALRDRLQASCPATVRLDELSMGMSGDYEVAIEEGRRSCGSARRCLSSEDVLVATFDLQSHPDGTVIPVRAQPGARRTRSAAFKTAR